MTTIDDTHPVHVPPRMLSAPTNAAQRVGAGAALVEGLCFIAGLFMFLIIQPALGWKINYWDDPSKAVLFVRAHQMFFQSGALLFALQALLVVPIVLAVHGRLAARSRTLAVSAAAFGVLGAGMLVLNATVQYAEFRNFASLPTSVAEQAEAYATVAYDATAQASGLCLGLWMLLLGLAALLGRVLPTWFGYLTLVVGIAYLAEIVFPPPSQMLSIPWFIALGGILLRGGSHVR